MKKILYTLAFILLSLYSFAQKGSVEGHIYDKNTNEPIMFANVIVQGSSLGASSDQNGHFIIKDVPVGFIRLVATSIGYSKTQTPVLQVFNNKSVNQNVYLEPNSTSLTEVNIVSDITAKKAETPLSVQTITVEDIEKSPGANRDVSKVVQNLPGVVSTAVNRNDLIVRGGGASENVFYLDGIEIPIINHFATQGSGGGAVGIINPDFVREVEFFTSAFPASKGNALSSVMNIVQKDGSLDRPHFKASVGASDLAITLDIPTGSESTLLLSYRRSYLQFLFQALGLPFLPTYNDYQFRHNVKFDSKNDITFIGIGAVDNMVLNTGIKNPNESQRYLLNYLPVYNQWNYTMGGIYRHYSSNFYNKWILSRNALNNSSYKRQNNDENLPKVMDYNSLEAENKLRYEHYITNLPFEFMFGGGIKYSRYRTESFRKIFANNQLITDEYNTNIDLFAYQLFTQASDKYLNEKLSLSFGIRFDGSTYSKEMVNPLNQFSPRLSASYDLSNGFFINSSIGRYNQMPAYTTLGYKDSTGSLVNKKNNLKYIDVNHGVIGLEYKPNNKFKASIEGFYKQYYNYPISLKDGISLASKVTDFGTVGDEAVSSLGKGRSYGAEFLIKLSESNKYSVYSTFTYYVSKFTDINNNYISSSWDNRYVFNISANRQLKYNWTLSARWRFIGGSPYTPIDLDLSSSRQAWDAKNQAYLDYSKYNTLRLANFHQLDIRIDKEFFWRKVSLTLYVDIQNVYNFKQESVPIYSNLTTSGQPNIVDPNLPEAQQQYRIREISSMSGTILPTIGIIAYF